MNKTVLILEDNKVTLEVLSTLVAEINPNIHILKFSSMEGIYEAVFHHTVDLFLIDIVVKTEIPGDTSGIRFADKIRSVAEYEFTPIIFITSLEDPKLYAYSELHSFGYIEKPFDAERVRHLIQKALRFPRTGHADQTLFFRKDGLLFSIKSSEILYIESINHKMYFHRTDGGIMVIPYKTCKQIMDEAGDNNLVQCSRSVIVNKNYVENIDLVNRYLQLKGIDEYINIGITFQKRMSALFSNV